MTHSFIHQTSIKHHRSALRWSPFSFWLLLGYECTADRDQRPKHFLFGCYKSSETVREEMQAIRWCYVRKPLVLWTKNSFSFTAQQCFLAVVRRIVSRKTMLCTACHYLKWTKLYKKQYNSLIAGSRQRNAPTGWLWDGRAYHHVFFPQLFSVLRW